MDAPVVAGGIVLTEGGKDVFELVAFENGDVKFAVAASTTGEKPRLVHILVRSRDVEKVGRQIARVFVLAMQEGAAFEERAK